jgi:hypothetical protein
VVKHGRRLLGEKPILIGECGIPMDLNQKKAFLTGDYAHHTNFLDAVLRAMENNLVHFTLWNYNPHNDHFYGDYWNGEDFSIFTKSIAPSETSSIQLKPSGKKGTMASLQTQTKLIFDKDKGQELVGTPDSLFDLTEEFFDDDNEHSGGRALDAVIRPYAAKTAGKPLSTLFLLEDIAFELVFVTPKHGDYDCDSVKSRTTEIFVPSFHYGKFKKPHIIVSDGVWDYDREKQTVYWVIDPTKESPHPNTNESIQWIAAKNSIVTSELIESHNFHTIQITPSPPPMNRNIGCSSMLCNIL